MYTDIQERANKDGGRDERKTTREGEGKEGRGRLNKEKDSKHMSHGVIRRLTYTLPNKLVVLCRYV